MSKNLKQFLYSTNSFLEECYYRSCLKNSIRILKIELEEVSSISWIH
nr:MAG TPA: hypothetical protein [Caudoviricetes sp.]